MMKFICPRSGKEKKMDVRSVQYYYKIRVERDKSLNEFRASHGYGMTERTGYGKNETAAIRDCLDNMRLVTRITG